MKLILLSLVATLVAAVSLAAVARARHRQTVRVTEVDYSIRLSAKPKPAVKFDRNAGDDARLLAQGRRQDLEDARHRRGRLGDPDRDAEEGRQYAFWCGVGSHRSKGMSGSFVAR